MLDKESYLLDDLFREIIYEKPMGRYPMSLSVLPESFFIGIDPIDPISTPKSEGNDLVFKTQPKMII